MSNTATSSSSSVAASRVPSGLKAKSLKPFVRCRVLINRKVDASQIATALSSPIRFPSQMVAAIDRPSGLNSAPHPFPLALPAVLSVRISFPGCRVPDHRLGEAVRYDSPAIRAIGDPSHILARAVQLVKNSSGRNVPDHGFFVELGRDEIPAVWAKRHVHDLASSVADNREEACAGPHQVIPFPAAQVGRALGQELVHATQVAHRKFALGQGDPVEIERFSERHICVGGGLTRADSACSPLPCDGGETHQEDKNDRSPSREATAGLRWAHFTDRSQALLRRAGSARFSGTGPGHRPGPVPSR